MLQIRLFLKVQEYQFVPSVYQQNSAFQVPLQAFILIT